MDQPTTLKQAIWKWLGKHYTIDNDAWARAGENERAEMLREARQWSDTPEQRQAWQEVEEAKTK